MVTPIDGSACDPFLPDTLASNGPLHSVLVESFSAKSESPRIAGGRSDSYGVSVIRPYTTGHLLPITRVFSMASSKEAPSTHKMASR